MVTGAWLILKTFLFTRLAPEMGRLKPLRFIPLTSYVTLGRLLNPFEPVIFICKTGAEVIITPTIYLTSTISKHHMC